MSLPSRGAWIETAELTRQGKSGGICKDHQEQFTLTQEKIEQLKKAFRKARGK